MRCTANLHQRFRLEYGSGLTRLVRLPRNGPPGKQVALRAHGTNVDVHLEVLEREGSSGEGTVVAKMSLAEILDAGRDLAAVVPRMMTEGLLSAEALRATKASILGEVAPVYKARTALGTDAVLTAAQVAGLDDGALIPFAPINTSVNGYNLQIALPESPLPREKPWVGLPHWWFPALHGAGLSVGRGDTVSLQALSNAQLKEKHFVLIAAVDCLEVAWIDRAEGRRVTGKELRLAKRDAITFTELEIRLVAVAGDAKSKEEKGQHAIFSSRGSWRTCAAVGRRGRVRGGGGSGCDRRVAGRGETEGERRREVAPPDLPSEAARVKRRTLRAVVACS